MIDDIWHSFTEIRSNLIKGLTDTQITSLRQSLRFQGRQTSNLEAPIAPLASENLLIDTINSVDQLFPPSSHPTALHSEPGEPSGVETSEALGRLSLVTEPSAIPLLYAAESLSPLALGGDRRIVAKDPPAEGGSMEVQAGRGDHVAPVDLITGGGPVGEATETSLPLRGASHGEESQQLLIQRRGSSRAMLRRGSSRALQQVRSMTTQY